MAAIDSEQAALTVVGKITAHYGVRGWVRVRSYMRPAGAIVDFATWQLLDGEPDRRSGEQDPCGEVCPVESREQRNGFVVRLAGVTDREQAEPLIGCTIAIARAELPELPPGEYYWEQLVGLEVINEAGESLGRVDHLVETGANDVLVVHEVSGDGTVVERLLPWAEHVVLSVDTAAGTMRVDWDAEY